MLVVSIIFLGLLSDLFYFLCIENTKFQHFVSNFSQTLYGLLLAQSNWISYYGGCRRAKRTLFGCFLIGNSLAYPLTGNVDVSRVEPEEIVFGVILPGRDVFT